MHVRKATTLIEALGLREREHLAMVGAGGKTTLLFALSSALRAVNREVLTSTTTKMWYPEPAQVESVWLTALNEAWKEGIRNDLGHGKSVFLGGRMLESGKVQGVDPSVLDILYQEKDLDYLLVEADGSAGHPVKAHSPKEPVVPGSATMLVAVMGVEALGKPFTPEFVFRADAFERITGIHPGEIITVPPLSRLFIHPEGLFKFAPRLARKAVFLNKTDLVHDREQVGELTGLILADEGTRAERVVVGSMRNGEFWVAQSA